MAHHDGIIEGMDCDNSAAMAGYTQQYIAECAEHSMHVSLRPDADLDGRVKAWDHDNQEWITINGWLWDFEPVAE